MPRRRVPLSAYFDGWYADMERSPVKDEIEQRHLGLPPHLKSTSLLPWGGVDDVVAALRLRPGNTVLDLACGRGGYGLEVAHRTRAALVGVDFSGEAVRQAREQAGRLGREADFRVGDLAATGLEDASVHGLLCLDSVQFAEQPAAVYAELRRVLVPGGRAVLSCWEPREPGDERLPERLRAVDLGAGLAAAGFVDVEVREMTGWDEVERALWTEAAELDPGADPALQSFHDEGFRAVPLIDLRRRVLASATAPGAR